MACLSLLSSPEISEGRVCVCATVLLPKLVHCRSEDERCFAWFWLPPVLFPVLFPPVVFRVGKQSVPLHLSFLLPILTSKLAFCGTQHPITPRVITKKTRLVP